MCLGIPGQVVEVLEGNNGQLALVDVEGVARKINIGMLDDAALAPGDWVIIHMGMALEKVDRQQAAEALSGLELLGRGAEDT
ncbi:MAG: HypC/HybG/HupF family hydrogenase formation chaperone [Actinomycetota bacterium]|nr:HypC/HybG/HupF family hydrogenase formation chaperone [Actinomycetota bacterium]